MLIYVASPFRPNGTRSAEMNSALVIAAMRWVVNQGHFPVPPHALLPLLLDDTDPTARDRGIRLSIEELLPRCHQLWVFHAPPVPHLSDGMQREIDAASKRGTPMLHWATLDDGRSFLQVSVGFCDGPATGVN